MKKKILSLGLIWVFLLLPLYGCNQNSTHGEFSAWDPPVQGLKWGMSQEKAIEVLKCEDSCEIVEQNGFNLLTVTGNYPSAYGVDFEVMALQFMTDNSGIEGYEGLFTFSGTCKEEDVEALQTKLNETYADFRKTDDFSNTQRWESPAIKDLDNAQEIENALAEKLGDSSEMQQFQMVAMGAPMVNYQLFLEGETCGMFQANAKYQVLYNAVKP